MMTRPKRLMLLAIAIGSLALYWGCAQPDSILVEKSQTVLYLEPERMPTTPFGLIYNLCVAEDVVDDSVRGVEVIAAFGYDWESRTFLDASGVARPDTNRFVMTGDLYNYGYIMITVQRRDGSDIGTGPVMLIDMIQDPFYDPLIMLFPHMDTVTNSQAFYHMKSVSDDDSYGDTTTNTAGAALWFNSVSYDIGFLQDTIRLDSFTIDTIWKESILENIESIVNVTNYDSVVEVPRGFGLDTIMQTAVRYEVETHIAYVDSAPSDPRGYLTTNTTFYYLIGAEDSTGQWNQDSVLTVPFDNHVQIGNYWKDLTGYGWVYRGWVVSSAIEDARASVGNMTRPAWIGYNTAYDSVIRGIEGGLLSTGAFVSLENPDYLNQYLSDRHAVPPYPGEDFLFVPGASMGPVQLVPGGGSTGTIFITAEPTNATNDTTNFPLIVASVELPSSRNQVTALRQGHVADGENPYSYSLIGRAITDSPASQVGPVLIGFPQIEVKFERQ